MATYAVYARLIVEADNADQALVLAGVALDETDYLDDFWVETEYEPLDN